MKTYKFGKTNIITLSICILSIFSILLLVLLFNQTTKIENKNFSSPRALTVDEAIQVEIELIDTDGQELKYLMTFRSQDEENKIKK